MIIEKITVGSFSANCYIVGCEKTKEGIIIDPGDEVEKILELINKNGLDIKMILNTHAHIDHSLGIQGLKEKLGVNFCMHKDDLSFLEHLIDQAQFFGLKANFPPKVDRFLEDNDEISFGELKARVIHTPGHTPGGLSFLIEDSIFVGDTLFSGSIGRTDLPGGSYEKLIHSIKSKLLTLKPNTKVFPGHGPPTNIEIERKTNPFLKEFQESNA